MISGWLGNCLFVTEKSEVGTTRMANVRLVFAIFVMPANGRQQAAERCLCQHWRFCLCVPTPAPMPVGRSRPGREFFEAAGFARTPDLHN